MGDTFVDSEGHIDFVLDIVLLHEAHTAVVRAQQTVADTVLDRDLRIKRDDKSFCSEYPALDDFSCVQNV